MYSCQVSYSDVVYLSSQDYHGMLTLLNDRFNDRTAELSGTSSDSNNGHGLHIALVRFLF